MGGAPPLPNEKRGPAPLSVFVVVEMSLFFFVVQADLLYAASSFW